MGFDLRDFFFECAKEYTKQGLQYNIRQQCNELRRKAMAIPEEYRSEAFAYIDGVEQNRLQGVEREAMDASAAKEILKIMGF